MQTREFPRCETPLPNEASTAECNNKKVTHGRNTTNSSPITAPDNVFRVSQQNCFAESPSQSLSIYISEPKDETDTSSRLASPEAYILLDGLSCKDGTLHPAQVGTCTVHHEGEGTILNIWSSNYKVVLLSVVYKTKDSMPCHAMPNFPCCTSEKQNAIPKPSTQTPSLAQDNRPKKGKRTFWIPKGNLCTP
jgi:hypothetical protein